MRRLTNGLAAAFLGLGLALGLGVPTLLAEEEAEVPEQEWSFEGIFGTFDRAAAQRGFQVYNEVCAACHSLRLVAFRNLSALGFTDEEVKAFAAEYTVTDGPNDDGEMFERAAIPSDRFPPPFPNAKAAAVANGGAVPADLSLITKARAPGPNYVYAILTGYLEAPAEFEVAEGANYNPYFPGHQIVMPQPIFGDDVEFADGTAATLGQEARDVATFLTWTADPVLEQRKRMGIKVILFLIVFTGLLYAVKRKIWANLEH